MRSMASLVFAFTVVLVVAGSLAWAKVAPKSQPAASTTTTSASKPTTTTSSAPADEWTELFENERWYKGHKAKEQVFSGKLEAIKNADRPNTLMRTSYYRLGRRTIYTKAKNVKALDALVGREVEFRGKPYDIELEGQAVSEIWPAAVRAK